MLEVLREVGVVEEGEPESREEGVGLTGVLERRRELRDGLDEDVLTSDGIVVIVLVVTARGFLLEDLER